MDIIIVVDVLIGELIFVDFEDQVFDDDFDVVFLDMIFGCDQSFLLVCFEFDECWVEEDDDYYDDEMVVLDMFDEMIGIFFVFQLKVIVRVQ